MSAERAWLIDASIYIFRAWFSLPDRWHTRDGWSVNAVYGYTKFLLDFLDATALSDPAAVGAGSVHCAAAFDESLGTCFRNEIYPAYKSSRELPDDALAFQLRACREISERLGLPCYGGERYEADDYVASLARVCRERGVAVSVVTRDKDLGQLVLGPADHWWDFGAGVTLDDRAFTGRFGVAPAQFADYLALVGDPVDDIPGVPGVGARTAARLLQAFGNLEQMHGRLDEVSGLGIRGGARVQERLLEHWPQVLIARQLTGLEEHIGEVTEPPEFELRAAAVQGVADYLAELDIGGPVLNRCQTLARSLALP